MKEQDVYNRRRNRLLLNEKKLQEAKEFEETMQQVVLIDAVILVTFGLFVLLFTVIL